MTVAVTLSYAQTLDGRIATRTGSSQWISGPGTLELAHRLRATHDAILVGVGTVLADDPRLTVRLVDGPDPLRVVVDSRLRTPDAAAVLAGDAATGTVFAVADAPAARVRAIRALGADVWTLPDAAGRVDLAALLAELGRRGVRSVMAEGGAAVLTALLKGRHATRLVVTVAPLLLGAGVDAIGDLGIDRLADAVTLTDPDVSRHGRDLVLDAGLAYPDRPGVS